MTVRDAEAVVDAPTRSPMRRNAFYGLGGACGGCCLHPACITERKGREMPHYRAGPGWMHRRYRKPHARGNWRSA